MHICSPHSVEIYLAAVAYSYWFSVSAAQVASIINKGRVTATSQARPLTVREFILWLVAILLPGLAMYALLFAWFRTACS